MDKLIERIQARCDNAYSNYISQCGRQECLGWEAKVDRGRFGTAELNAHMKASEFLGRHRALADIVQMLEADE